MALFLALDVGGTKTDYVLADDDRIIARVRTGTIKRMRADVTTATANLEQALAELTERTGISMKSISRTCVGTAGNTVSLVTDWLRESITSRVAGELVLVGDVDIALDAAFQGGPGLLVMAGTGSNVAGRSESGEVMSVGGWGPVLADQGSGHRIGLEGLRAAFLTKDEGGSTTLLDAILEFWQLASVGALIEHANSGHALDFSQLTRLMLRCADEGDQVAAGVLKKQGEELGYLARLLIRRLLTASRVSHSGHRDALPKIAFTGSIMENVTPVRTALIDSVREEFPGIQTLAGVIDPIAGALWKARTGRNA